MSREDQIVLEAIRKVWDDDDKLHKKYRDKWDHLYGLHRNYDDLRSNWNQASKRERGGILIEAERLWGGFLFIPYVYALIETMTPRLLSRTPRIVAKPDDTDAEEYAKIVSDTLNQQAQEISYELKLTPTAKRGLKFGLGVQKTYWRRELRDRRLNVPSANGGLQRINARVLEREGPMAEDVDPYDFRWDKQAKNIETCHHVFHRTWRRMSYIADQVESGAWRPLDLEAVQGMASPEARDQVWQGRMQAMGFSASDLRSSDSAPHEIWEYWIGNRVLTVLDKQLVVQEEMSPMYHQELPYQIYRPTIMEGEFVGMSEIEPIEDVQAELSTLRTQRRDNATIALQRPFAYAKGFIDRKDLKFGPGIAIPTQGDPREALFPLPIQDIPASGYQEEEALKTDLEFVTGISETFAGGGGGDTAASDTATGIQLVQAAAGVRVAFKAKLLRLETILPAACQWRWLNHQHLLEDKTMRIDDPNNPQGYRFERVPPEAFAANITLEVEEGSTEPDNRPQRINDALSLWQAVQGNPEIDQRQALRYLLNEYGIRNPDEWIVSQTAVSPQALAQTLEQALEASGMPPDQAQEMTLQLVEQAQQTVPPDQAAAAGAAPTNGGQQAPAEPQAAGQ